MTNMQALHSQGGFITKRANYWSRNSRKQRRLKDRGWLPGSSALSAISLPLVVSGSCVGRAGPISGRRHQLDQMQDTTHHDRHDQDAQSLHNTNTHLHNCTKNVHLCKGEVGGGAA